MADHSHHSTIDIKNPGPWKVSSSARGAFLAFIVVGLIVFVAGLKSGQESRVWSNVLTNYFFYLCLSIGGAFIIALVHVAGAFWGSPFRRVAEGLMTYLPVAFALGLAIHLLGGHTLYHWMHADVLAHDSVLAAKAGYLNSKFAIVRMVVFFAIWIFFSRKFIANSLAQDLTGDVGLTHRMVKLSAIFLPLFALSFSYFSFDLIMSLEPHWFSTMFGVYCFAGMFLSTVSVMALITIVMKKRGLMPVVNENHLHDLGKFMFAFTVFWAYIMFSQFMLIWYANLPEETTYYIRRFVPGWSPLCWAMLIGQFIIPFFALLPREAKRCEKHLTRMAIFILAMHWLDCYLMVVPNFSASGPQFGWIEGGLALGFFGLFAFTVTTYYGRVPALAFRDPRLKEAAEFHQ